MTSWAKPLAGKRVLVVGGGGGGNGSSISRAVAGAGAEHVVVADLSAENAEAEIAPIDALGSTATAVTCDVRVSGEMDRVVAESVETMGGIDVAITVVGGHNVFAPWQPATSTTDEQWQLSFTVNLDYVFRTVRAVVPRFIDQGTGGSIVSIGSINGVRSSPMSVAYGSSKLALISLARTVSLEYARHDVRMNVLSLGLVQTPAGDAVNDADDSGSRIARMSRTIPLGRPGRPEEVGNAVVFLASPLSGYISGQNLTMDGALTNRAPLHYEGTDESMAG